MNIQDMVNLLKNDETLVMRKTDDKVCGHINFDENEDDFLFCSMEQLQDYLYTDR